MAEIKLEDAPQGVRTFYDKGVAAMERKNLDYAMDMFEAALHLEPRILYIRKLLRAAAVQKRKTHAPGKLAAFKLAASHLKITPLIKKNPLQALEAAEILIRTDPFNIRSVLLLRNAAVAAALPEIAIQSLEILKDHKPGDLAVLEPLAELYLDVQDYKNEYACRNQINRLKPNDSSSLKKLKDAAAHNTMEKARWDTAESFQDLIKESPAPKLSDEKSEIERCLEKMKREPGNIEHLKTVAKLYLLNRQFDEALQTLEAGIKPGKESDSQLDKILADIHNKKAAHEIAQAEETGDINYADKLRKKLRAMKIHHAAEQVKYYPNDLLLKFEYGVLLFENKRFSEAIQHLQLAQKNSKNRIKALYYLACAFKEKGQLDIALQQLDVACNECSKMDEDKKMILYEIGLLHEATNHPELAIQAFKKIYTVDIGYRDVVVKIDQAYNK